MSMKDFVARMLAVKGSLKKKDDTESSDIDKEVPRAADTVLTERPSHTKQFDRPVLVASNEISPRDTILRRRSSMLSKSTPRVRVEGERSFVSTDEGSSRRSQGVPSTVSVRRSRRSPPLFEFNFKSLSTQSILMTSTVRSMSSSAVRRVRNHNRHVSFSESPTVHDITPLSDKEFGHVRMPSSPKRNDTNTTDEPTSGNEEAASGDRNGADVVRDSIDRCGAILEVHSDAVDASAPTVVIAAEAATVESELTTKAPVVKLRRSIRINEASRRRSMRLSVQDFKKDEVNNSSNRYSFIPKPTDEAEEKRVKNRKHRTLRRTSPIRYSLFDVVETTETISDSPEVLKNVSGSDEEKSSVCAASERSLSPCSLSISVTSLLPTTSNLPLLIPEADSEKSLSSPIFHCSFPSPTFDCRSPVTATSDAAGNSSTASTVASVLESFPNTTSAMKVTSWMMNYCDATVGESTIDRDQDPPLTVGKDEGCDCETMFPANSRESPTVSSERAVVCRRRRRSSLFVRSTNSEFLVDALIDAPSTVEGGVHESENLPTVDASKASFGNEDFAATGPLSRSSDTDKRPEEKKGTSEGDAQQVDEPTAHGGNIRTRRSERLQKRNTVFFGKH